MTPVITVLVTIGCGLLLMPIVGVLAVAVLNAYFDRKERFWKAIMATITQKKPE